MENDYIRKTFVVEDEVLQSIQEGLLKRGLPLISVPPEVGYTLYLFVKMVGAKRALEIGTLGGYSTIWIARALPKDGQVVTLELNETHASFAQENIDRAGLANLVSIKVGDAVLSLQELKDSGEKFDFVFIDADKLNYPRYLDYAIQLSNSGGVIALDNLFFHGRVLDEQDQNPAPQALRQTHQMLAKDPRIEGIILPIGDGLGIARVK